MKPHKIRTAILLTIITVSGLLVIHSVNAAVSKPSMPQFTVSTSSNGEVIIKIINQANQDTNTSHLYYQVRTKDHDSNNWEIIEVFRVEESGYWHREPYQRASLGQYTTISINTEIKQEFQVQALIGYITTHNDHALDLFGALTTFMFYGESSDWSPTQSIDDKVSTSTARPTPTTTQTTPTHTPQATATTSNTQIDLFDDIDWQNVALMVMALAITVLGVAVIILWRRIPKRAS